MVRILLVIAVEGKYIPFVPSVAKSVPNVLGFGTRLNQVKVRCQSTAERIRLSTQ